MNPKDREELNRQVNGLLKKGYIQHSLSPCAVPALLTLKKDGLWRMCVDSRAINKITVKYRFLILRVKLHFLDSSSQYKACPQILQRSEPSKIGQNHRHCIKHKEKFEWTPTASTAFNTIKEKLLSAPVLVLLDFHKCFEVACHTSGVGIGGVLSQEGHPIAYFSEKLNEAKQKYSTYDKEFYAIEFTFVVKHCLGVENKVVDALSWRIHVLNTLTINVVGFDKFKDEYTSCPDFGIIYDEVKDATAKLM
ncbi:uncharacterized protein LOC114742652 [Neltuma alba]|uniref:uncharacterized protein LOC114742652 n=1 Tax=Neltuma alba TaxID=207710 RepID=UPI0010A45828|nr:uncharacterized protein LOC114742652 [Prosopis alba]